MQGYLTLVSPSIGEYEEKRSRFIAEIRPIQNEDEAVSFIKEVKTKYWDARHNVYAYRLHGGVCRYSDDGEPHGTAAKPILDIIVGRNLENVCIVVTRYFGGVLLGTGGLVRAYSEAAKEAVNNASIVEMGLLGQYLISCDYGQYNKLLPFIHNMGGTVTDTVYESDITVKFSLPEDKSAEFSDSLTDAFSGRLKLEQEGQIFAPVKILG